MLVVHGLRSQPSSCGRPRPSRSHRRRRPPTFPTTGELAPSASAVHDGPAVTRLVIDVGRGDEGRLSGTITCEERDPATFDGTIELLARIEDLVDRGRPDGPVPDPPR